MSKLRYLLAACLLVSSCSREAPHKHHAQAPLFVSNFAEKQLDTLSDAHDKQFRRYVDGFLEGYVTRPGRSVASEDNPYMAGMGAGEEYRRQRRADVAMVLSGFGYEAVTTRGRFTSGYEEFAFAPSGHPSKKWWIFGSLSGDESAAYPTCNEGTLTGFLSPPGRYGHLGGYEHNIIVGDFKCDT